MLCCRGGRVPVAVNVSWDIVNPCEGGGHHGEETAPDCILWLLAAIGKDRMRFGTSRVLSKRTSVGTSMFTSRARRAFCIGVDGGGIFATYRETIGVATAG